MYKVRKFGYPVPEFIDPVFAKTSPKRSFLVIENERFRLVFAKTGSINSGTVLRLQNICVPIIGRQNSTYKTYF